MRIYLRPVMLAVTFIMIECATVAAQYFSPIMYAKGKNPAALLTGDFNNDGKLDIASFVYPGSGVSVMLLLGNGSSGFKSPTFVAITSVTSPNALVTGDFSDDGKLDLLVAGLDPVTGTPAFSIFLGNGDGTFQDPINTQGMVGVVGDFNRDGDLDVITTAGMLLPGNGDGTFGVAKSISQTLPQCPVTADVNKDGKLDLVGRTSVLLGNGDGTFQSPLSITDQKQQCGTVLADLNHDGVLDMVQLVRTTVASNPDGIIAFLGNGDGTFQQGVKYKLNPATESFAVNDFNSDGNLDVAAWSAKYTIITVVLGNGKGSFRTANSYIGGTLPTHTPGPINLIGGDFNGDNKIDLAIPNRTGIGVLLGNADGTFQSGISINKSSSVLRTADLNGDGKSDLVVGNSVSLSLGKGKFGPWLPLLSGCIGTSIVLADFNKDGKLDLASTTGLGGGVTNGGVAVCLGNGDGTFQSPVIYDSGTWHGVVRAGDFNKDGNIDIAAADVGGVSVFLGNGDGTFQTGTPTAVGSSPMFTVGDFNHDGKLDLVAIVGSAVSVLLGKGNGTFQSPISSPNVAALQLAAADLNRDNSFDAVTANGSSNNVSVLLGKGDGTFQPATLYGVVANPVAVVIHDFNGDGNLDIAVPDNNGNYLASVLLNKGDGTFMPQKTFQVNTFPKNVASADFNGNGGQDLAVLCKYNITVLLNRTSH